MDSDPISSLNPVSHEIPAYAVLARRVALPYALRLASGRSFAPDGPMLSPDARADIGIAGHRIADTSVYWCPAAKRPYDAAIKTADGAYYLVVFSRGHHSPKWAQPKA